MRWWKLTLVAAAATLILVLPTTASAANAKLDRVERAAIKRINIYRKNKGRRPLKINARLTRAAHWKARDIRAMRRVRHVDSRGRRPQRMLWAFGYPKNRWIGENLAAGQRTAKQVMRGWRRSPAHNRNLLHGKFRKVGIARVHAGRGPYRWYWALELGS